MSDKMKIGIGVAVTLFLAFIAYSLLHKPAAKTYAKGGVTPGTAPNPISAVAATIKKVGIDKSKPLNIGDSGDSVQALQELIGEFSTNAYAPDGNFPGITADGKWGAETTTALTWLLNGWNIPVALPITISQLGAFSTNPVAMAKYNATKTT